MKQPDLAQLIFQPRFGTSGLAYAACQGRAGGLVLSPHICRRLHQQVLHQRPQRCRVIPLLLCLADVHVGKRLPFLRRHSESEKKIVIKDVYFKMRIVLFFFLLINCHQKELCHGGAFKRLGSKMFTVYHPVNES